ncbi:hypothetical protein DYB36_002117 [Aphanomyces astaci]|uniref:EamA domain-containing protein n=1 Tax=Aphanomyces astaci TaxID=112090 RepID=A0A397BTK6_APHAT|nr:hypothetical protein DYB36_002117 [Aphanomyces astaci]
MMIYEILSNLWSTALHSHFEIHHPSAMRAQVHLHTTKDAAEVTPLLIEPASAKTHVVGVVLVALSAVACSLVATFVKYVSIDLTSMEASFWRFAIAYALVLVLVLYSKADLLVAPQHHWDLAWRCIFSTASVISFFWAINETALADATTIAAITPVVAFFVGAWMRQEPIGLVDVIVAVAALAGVVFVARPNVVFEVPIISTGSPYAALGAIGSAVFAALANVHVQKLSGLPAVVVAHYVLLVGATVSGVLHHSGRTVSQAAIITGLVAFLGDLALVKGLEHLENPDTSSRTDRLLSAVRYADLALVFVWDATLIRERVNRWSVLGAVLVTVAVVTVHIRRASTRQHPSHHP